MTDLTFRAAILVAGGAIIGGLARWMIGVALTRDFPYGTLVVNVVGSFLIGIFAFGALARGWAGDDARLFVAVGMLGAFTTMSAFAYETVVMMTDGQLARATVNVLLNPILCVGAAYAGRAAALAM